MIACLSFSIEINTAFSFPDSSYWYLYAIMHVFIYASFTRRNLINGLVFIIPGGLIEPVGTKPCISKLPLHLLSFSPKNVICVPKRTITIRFSSKTSPREVVWITTSSISSHLTKAFLLRKHWTRGDITQTFRDNMDISANINGLHTKPINLRNGVKQVQPVALTLFSFFLFCFWWL